MTKHTMILLLLGLAGVLGVTACGDSGKQASLDSHNFDRVAQVVARHEDRVSTDDLARWMIEEKKDFTLIDVRPPDAYAKGHIDGARNLSVPELLSPALLKTLPGVRRIIVYSQGSETAAQAAVLLRLAGYNASLLLGGYNFWSQHVLNPDIHPTRADGEYSRVPRQQAIACYFVGGNTVAQAPVPVRKHRVPAFVPPVSRPAAPPPPASDEGC